MLKGRIRLLAAAMIAGMALGGLGCDNSGLYDPTVGRSDEFVSFQNPDEDDTGISRGGGSEEEELKKH